MNIIKHTKSTFIAITISLFVYLISPNNKALASGLLNSIEKKLLKTGEAAEYTPVHGSNYAIIIGRILKGLFGLLGSIFILLIIYGGYLWMTAGGNEEQITRAKKIITGAVIGLVIVAAFFIFNILIVDAGL